MEDQSSGPWFLGGSSVGEIEITNSLNFPVKVYRTTDSSGTIEPTETSFCEGGSLSGVKDGVSNVVDREIAGDQRDCHEVDVFWPDHEDEDPGFWESTLG